MLFNQCIWCPLSSMLFQIVVWSAVHGKNDKCLAVQHDHFSLQLLRQIIFKYVGLLDPHKACMFCFFMLHLVCKIVCVRLTCMRQWTLKWRWRTSQCVGLWWYRPRRPTIRPRSTCRTSTREFLSCLSLSELVLEAHRRWTCVFTCIFFISLGYVLYAAAAAAVVNDDGGGVFCFVCYSGGKFVIKTL